MSRGFILLVVALLVSFGAAGDCNDEANRAREEQRIDESIAILNECLTAELSRLARTWLLLGLAHYEKEEYGQATANYTKAIDVAPDYAVAYANRGLSHAMSSNFEAAISDFDRAIELRPEYVKAHYFRGYTHHVAGMYDHAVADYTHALENAAEAPRETRALIHYRRGLALKHKSDLEAVLDDYSRAIEIDPSLADAWFSRALIYQQDKDYDKAISDYSRVIELEPDNARAHYNRGLLYDKTDADHRAITDYKEALSLEPSYAKAKANLAIVRLVPFLPLLLVALLG